MKFIVHCELCVGTAPVAECPDRDSAEALVRRHYGLRGHESTVTRVLDTPHEGLVS